MTGRWLTYGQAREALAVTWTQLLDLLESGVLEAALIGDHYSIAEKSVSQLADGGDDLAESRTQPTVRGGPTLPADIEDEFQRGKESE